MVDDNQQYAYFTLAGAFDPAEITERVGISPTASWRTGDVCPRTHRERTNNRWKLYSRLGRDQELEAHIRDVLAQLDINREAFVTISRQYGGLMQLVAYYHRDYPGLGFDLEIVEGLARFALAVDFDFYWCDSSRREDT